MVRVILPPGTLTLPPAAPMVALAALPLGTPTAVATGVPVVWGCFVRNGVIATVLLAAGCWVSDRVIPCRSGSLMGLTHQPIVPTTCFDVK